MNNPIGSHTGSHDERYEQCRDLIDALYGYVEGNCAQSQLELIAQRAQECPRCLELLGIEQQIRQLLRQRCGQAAPQELRTRIVSQLHISMVDIRREG